MRRAGTVILSVAIVLWILAHLPLKDGKPPAIEASIVGQIGHAVEPAIRPLGFNWKIGIGLITSLAAREVILGTMGTIYGMEPNPKNEGLQQAIRRDLSLGGAVALPGPETSPSALLTTADQALYRAKARGRNQVVLDA